MRQLAWYVLSKLIGGAAAARFFGVEVGENCRIYSGNFGSEPWLISIGNHVTVTGGVSFLTHDGSTWLVKDTKGRRYRYAPIRVGSHVFIGINAIILPGVEIGDQVIVGAGAVVTKSVPAGVIVAGNPARQIGSYAEFHARALGWPSESDLFGTSRRARVDSAVSR